MSRTASKTSMAAPSPLAEQLGPYSALLAVMARKYIWWLSPDEALNYPARIVAQVMNIGEFRDAVELSAKLGNEILRGVLQQAEAGQFNERSWHYWHYRLGLAEMGQVPPLPVRRIQ